MVHAVVLVSGGDSVSPFTTPTAACSTGLAAGNTDTYLREQLLAAGYAVYTAPVMNVRGPVRDAEEGSFGAFGGQPLVLPAHLTILSNGDIDNAGEHLARFVEYLRRTAQVTDVSWVAHSNGGLFATAATRILRETDSPVQVRSIAALGTPWTGGVVQQVLAGEIDEADLGEDERALAIVAGVSARIAEGDLGLARQDTAGYLLGDGGWLGAQRGALDDVPALLVAGTRLRRTDANPQAWPFDALVSEYSALATSVPAEVIPHRETRSFDVYHSIYFADIFGEAWHTGMTWNPDVSAAVVAHLHGTR